MIFEPLDLEGSYVIEPEKIQDERGFFARSWDQTIFEKNNLNSKIVQCNVSFNKKKGTLRGMHFQTEPYPEEKLVRCTRGRAFEVIIDHRPNSKTFGKWTSIELSSKNYKMIYVPKGFALGFQTLEDNTELFYQMSQYFKPEFSSGIRWDDPKIKIEWPLEPTVISQKDQSWEYL
jgi:dTDP-4-dehydrorhamnose 3,5-epimerase